MEKLVDNLHWGGIMNIKEGDRVYYVGCSTPGHERPESYGVVHCIFPEHNGRQAVFVLENDGKVRPHWLHQLRKESNEILASERETAETCDGSGTSTIPHA
jgi:hypothetical protein